MTDQRDRPLHATIAVVLAIATAGYLAPWAIAAVRGRSNVWAVFWVNLLTGWTVLGWCIALYMSLTSHRRLRTAPQERRATTARTPSPSAIRHRGPSRSASSVSDSSTGTSSSPVASAPITRRVRSGARVSR